MNFRGAGRWIFYLWRTRLVFSPWFLFLCNALTLTISWLFLHIYSRDMRVVSWQESKRHISQSQTFPLIVCAQCLSAVWISLKNPESHLSGVSLTEGEPALTFLPHSLSRMQLHKLSLDETTYILLCNFGRVMLIGTCADSNNENHRYFTVYAFICVGVEERARVCVGASTALSAY